MSQGYYVGDALDNSREPMQQFSIIYQYMKSLEHRKRRLQLNRLSPRADMLEQRSHTSGLPLTRTYLKIARRSRSAINVG
jgi:hypothetical protein